MSFSTTTIYQRPDLKQRAGRLSYDAWPEFMHHSEVCNRHWPSLFTTFARFQVLLLDDEDKLVGLGYSLPYFWDDCLDTLPGGVDEMLERAVEGHARGVLPNFLSALAVVVANGEQRRGLSRLVIGAMKSMAGEHGLGGVTVPLRPVLKCQYPLTPFERYIEWKRADGSPFDPWQRAHWKLGAHVLSVAMRSMIVRGTVAEWEEWTKLEFPESGEYVVPGALVPVTIDRERDCGEYVEPNLWMLHEAERMQL